MVRCCETRGGVGPSLFLFIFPPLNFIHGLSDIGAVIKLLITQKMTVKIAIDDILYLVKFTKKREKCNDDKECRGERNCYFNKYGWSLY